MSEKRPSMTTGLCRSDGGPPRAPRWPVWTSGTGGRLIAPWVHETSNFRLTNDLVWRRLRTAPRLEKRHRRPGDSVLQSPADLPVPHQQLPGREGRQISRTQGRGHAAIVVTHRALKSFRSEGGSIVNISSAVAVSPVGDQVSRQRPPSLAPARIHPYRRSPPPCRAPRRWRRSTGRSSR